MKKMNQLFMFTVATVLLASSNSFAQEAPIEPSADAPSEAAPSEAAPSGVSPEGRGDRGGDRIDTRGDGPREDRGNRGDGPREDRGGFGRPDRGGFGRHDRGGFGRPDRGGFGRHDRDTSWSSDSSSIACAPEVVSSNVTTTDRTLQSLTKSSRFAKAKKFNASVARIAALKNPNQKAAQYFQMVGIDAKDSKAVVAFVGAREARGTWLVELQRNSDLSEKQAELVAKSLQNTLRGGLN